MVQSFARILTAIVIALAILADATFQKANAEREADRVCAESYASLTEVCSADEQFLEQLTLYLTTCPNVTTGERRPLRLLVSPTWATGSIPNGTPAEAPFPSLALQQYLNWSSVPVAVGVGTLSVTASSNGSTASADVTLEYAGWVSSPSTAAEAVAAAQELPDMLLLSSADLQWSDVMPAVRSLVSWYGTRLLALPVAVEVPLVLYSRDALSGAQEAPASTWPQLLQLLANLQQRASVAPTASASSANDGTAAGGDSGGVASSTSGGGQPAAGFCNALPPGCERDGDLLVSIWASMGLAALPAPSTRSQLERLLEAQLRGGALHALASALRLYRSLMAHAPPGAGHAPCKRPRLEVALQQCAVVVGASSTIKAALWRLGQRQQARRRRLEAEPGAAGGAARELLGGALSGGAALTAPLPGSTEAARADTGTLAKCGDGVEWNTTQCYYTLPPTARPPSQGTALLTRAVYLGTDVLAFHINATAPPQYQYAAWRAAAHALGANNSWKAVLTPTEGGATVLRISQLDNVDSWVSYGYDSQDIASYLSALGDSLRGPLTFTAPRLPAVMSARFAAIMAEAANAAAFGSNDVTRIAQDTLGALLASYESNHNSILSALTLHLHLANDTGLAAAARVPTGSVAGSIAGSAVGVAAVAALSVLWAWRGVILRSLRGRLRFLESRMSTAPGFGPDTTLMLTDVQGSTQLWEALPAVVMDSALSLHNDAFRQLLPRFRGYECHTEGDSFVLAFHTAVEAAGFALEIQLALLQLDWPQELLEHELCALVRQAPLDSNEGAAIAAATAAATTTADLQQLCSTAGFGLMTTGFGLMSTAAGEDIAACPAAGIAATGGSGAGSASLRGPNEGLDVPTTAPALEPWGLQAVDEEQAISENSEERLADMFLGRAPQRFVRRSRTFTTLHGVDEPDRKTWSAGLRRPPPSKPQPAEGGPADHRSLSDSEALGGHASEGGALKTSPGHVSGNALPASGVGRWGSPAQTSPAESAQQHTLSSSSVSRRNRMSDDVAEAALITFRGSGLGVEAQRGSARTSGSSSQQPLHLSPRRGPSSALSATVEATEEASLRLMSLAPSSGAVASPQRALLRISSVDRTSRQLLRQSVDANSNPNNTSRSLCLMRNRSSRRSSTCTTPPFTGLLATFRASVEEHGDAAIVAAGSLMCASGALGGVELTLDVPLSRMHINAAYRSNTSAEGEACEPGRGSRISGGYRYGTVGVSRYIRRSSTSSNVSANLGGDAPLIVVGDPGELRRRRRLRDIHRSNSARDRYSELEAAHESSGCDADGGGDSSKGGRRKLSRLGSGKGTGSSGGSGAATGGRLSSFQVSGGYLEQPFRLPPPPPSPPEAQLSRLRQAREGPVEGLSQGLPTPALALDAEQLAAKDLDPRGIVQPNRFHEPQRDLTAFVSPASSDGDDREHLPQRPSPKAPHAHQLQAQPAPARLDSDGTAAPISPVYAAASPFATATAGAEVLTCAEQPAVVYLQHNNDAYEHVSAAPRESVAPGAGVALGHSSQTSIGLAEPTQPGAHAGNPVDAKHLGEISAVPASTTSAPETALATSAADCGITLNPRASSNGPPQHGASRLTSRRSMSVLPVPAASADSLDSSGSSPLRGGGAGTAAAAWRPVGRSASASYIADADSVGRSGAYGAQLPLLLPPVGLSLGAARSGRPGGAALWRRQRAAVEYVQSPLGRRVLGSAAAWQGKEACARPASTEAGGIRLGFLGAGGAGAGRDVQTFNGSRVAAAAALSQGRSGRAATLSQEAGQGERQLQRAAHSDGLPCWPPARQCKPSERQPQRPPSQPEIQPNEEPRATCGEQEPPQGRTPKRTTALSDPGHLVLPGAGPSRALWGMMTGSGSAFGPARQPLPAPALLASGSEYDSAHSIDAAAVASQGHAVLATRRPPIRSVTPPPRFMSQHLPARMISKAASLGNVPMYAAGAQQGGGASNRTTGGGYASTGPIVGQGQSILPGAGRMWGGLEALIEAYSNLQPRRWPSTRTARGSMTMSSMPLVLLPGHDTGSGMSTALLQDGRSSDGRAAMSHPDPSLGVGFVGYSASLPHVSYPPPAHTHARDRHGGGRSSNTGRLMTALSSALRSRRISALGEAGAVSSSKRLHVLSGAKGSTHAAQPDSSPATFLEAMLQLATAPPPHHPAVQHVAAGLTSAGSGNGSSAGLRRSVTPPGLPGAGSGTSDSRRVHALHRLVMLGSGSREGEAPLPLAVASGSFHSRAEVNGGEAAVGMEGCAALGSGSGGVAGAGRMLPRGPSGLGLSELGGSGAASSGFESPATGQESAMATSQPPRPISSPHAAHLTGVTGIPRGVPTPSQQLPVLDMSEVGHASGSSYTDRVGSFLGREGSRGHPSFIGRRSARGMWTSAEGTAPLGMHAGRMWAPGHHPAGLHPQIVLGHLRSGRWDGSVPSGAHMPPPLPPQQPSLNSGASGRLGGGSGSSTPGESRNPFRAFSLPLRRARASTGAGDSPGQHSPALSPRASLQALDGVEAPGSGSSAQWVARQPLSNAGSFLRRPSPPGSAASQLSSLAAPSAAPQPPPAPALPPSATAAPAAAATAAAEVDRTSATVRLSAGLRHSRSAPWRSSRGKLAHTGRTSAHARQSAAGESAAEQDGSGSTLPEPERATWSAGVRGRPALVPPEDKLRPPMHLLRGAGERTGMQAVRMSAFAVGRSGSSNATQGPPGPASPAVALPTTTASSNRVLLSTSASASAAAAAAASSSAADSFDEHPRSSRSALLPSPAGSYTRAGFTPLPSETGVGGYAVQGRGLSPLGGPSGRLAAPPHLRVPSLGLRGRMGTAVGSHLESDTTIGTQEITCGELLRSCNSVTQTDTRRAPSEDRDMLLLTSMNATAHNGILSSAAAAAAAAAASGAVLNTASSTSLRASRHGLPLAAPSPVATMSAIHKSGASVTAAYNLAAGSGTRTAGGRGGPRESASLIPATEGLLTGIARRLDSIALPTVGAGHSDMPQWDAAARDARSRQASGAVSFVGRLGVGVVQRLANTSKKGLGPSAAVLDHPIAFRGFRVRCGMHSGLEQGRDVYWNKVSGRRAYSGPAMALAKTVSDLVPGGMVVLTADTFARLQPWPKPEVLPGAIMWCRGRFHVLLGGGGGEGGAPGAEVDLYQLLCPQLLARQPHLERRPWRGAQQVLPGVLSAPLGHLALVLVQAVGVQVLSAWDEQVTRASLQLFGSSACEVLAAWGGFPASLDTHSGTLLAAFKEPALALGFMHALLDVLRDAEWPPALLEHELGEPLLLQPPAGGTGGTVTPTGPDSHTAALPGAEAAAGSVPLAFRGLRVRCVADLASVRVDLGCATAASLYEARDPKAFKALRRMLRLAHMGGVLCSGPMVAQVLAGPPAALATLHELLAFSPLSATQTGAATLPQLSPQPSAHLRDQPQQQPHPSQPASLNSPSLTPGGTPRLHGSATPLGRAVGAGGGGTMAIDVVAPVPALTSPIMPVNARLTGKEASRSAVYLCTRRRPLRRSAMGNADSALHGSAAGVYGNAAAVLYGAYGGGGQPGYASMQSTATNVVME